MSSAVNAALHNGSGLSGFGNPVGGMPHKCREIVHIPAFFQVFQLGHSPFTSHRERRFPLDCMLRRGEQYQG